MAMQVLQLTKLKLDVIQIINTNNTLLQLSQQQKPVITSKMKVLGTIMTTTMKMLVTLCIDLVVVTAMNT